MKPRRAELRDELSIAERESIRWQIVKQFPNTIIINDIKGDLANITILVEHEEGHLKDFITINYKTGEVI